MLKRFHLLMMAVISLTAIVAGCGRNDPEEVIDPADLVDLKATIAYTPTPADMIFSSNPAFVFQLENPNAAAVEASLKVRILSDLKKEAAVVEKKVKVNKKGSEEITVSIPDAVAPGFYTAYCYLDGKTVKTIPFGLSPFEIVSAPDKQPDYDTFWSSALTQLEGVEMNAELTEITTRSSAKRKVYLVEMKSVPDGLTGDPVTVRGYYAEPQDGKKHPVIMHYYGYDSSSNAVADCPYGGSDDTFAEFYLSTRGQMLNNRPANRRVPDGKGDFVNTYGDWFAFQFGDKNGYYYRGAFMDVVQGIRFMATRPTSDMNNVFAEGSSQGGAFSYAAAALSPYPLRAIAPCVAFLGDFPDYFKIVSWPGNTARAHKGSMTDEEMYAFLSYFDTKNLATRINAAVIACSGLLDTTCPPHTNTAPFNNLPGTDKVMYYYPKLKHEIPSGWSAKYMTFFKERIK